MDLLCYSNLLYIPGILQMVLIEGFKLTLIKLYANTINICITKVYLSL
jgi:hypothetical protein